MERYCFLEDIFDELNGELWRPLKCIGKKKVIKYKCLICNCFMKEYDDTWSDDKKAEVTAEADAHHNDHINLEKV